ncbi:hypothetical protein N2152v2_005879 [Parachlorella kessleri]
MLSDDEEASTCWSAYDYLEHKRREAEAGCAFEVRDTGRPGASCARLQALEQLSYELIGSGQVSSIVNTLATLSRTDIGSGEQQVASGGEAVAFMGEGDLVVAHPQGQQEVESTDPDRRAYLRSLFSRLDHDHDGQLDMEEFRAAMRELGDELDGRTVALVGEALDAHGRLDEDQFLQLAQVYQLALSDLPPGSRQQLAQLVEQLLAAGGTASSGVALLIHFPELQQDFDVAAILEELIAGAQLTTAARWAESLSRAMQVAYVTSCLQYGHLKSAARAVKDLGLQQEFPDVEAAYKRKTVDKLAAKGLWGVAATYVGDDPVLQGELMHSLLLAGEVVLAQEFAHLFGRAGLADFGICEEQLQQERQRRAETYLQLSIPWERLHFVDTLAGLAAMQLALQEQLGLHAQPPGAPQHLDGSVLHGGLHAAKSGPVSCGHVTGASAPASAAAGGAAPGSTLVAPTAAGGHGDTRAAMHDWASARAAGLPVVGLDVEWRPERQDGEGGSSPASIVQLAVDSDVFVVDLLALGGQPQELSAALGPMLSSERVYKLGVGLASDVRKLGASYPQVAGFRTVNGCLDLGSLWKQCHTPHHGAAPPGYGVVAGGVSSSNGNLPLPIRGRGEVGLSALAEELLSKPLDKSSQVSDWARRPLTEAQLRYAALDAHVAVLIFRGLQQLNPAFNVQSGLEPYAFSVRLPPHVSGSHKRHWSDADSSRKGDDDENGGNGCGGGGSAAAGTGPAARGDLGTGLREGGGGQGECCEMGGGSEGQAGDKPSDRQGSCLELAGGASIPDPAQAPSVQQRQERQPGGDGVMGSLTDTGSDAAGPAWIPQAGALSLVPAALAQHLRHHGLESAVLPLAPSPGGSSTGGSIEEAAMALDIPSHRFCKALAVLRPRGLRGGYAAVALLPGDLRLSLRKALLLPRMLLPHHMIRLPAVAVVMGWPARDIRLASREECSSIFGYPPGAMPPCGYSPAVVVVAHQGLLPLAQHAAAAGCTTWTGTQSSSPAASQPGLSSGPLQSSFPLPSGVGNGTGTSCQIAVSPNEAQGQAHGQQHAEHGGEAACKQHGITEAPRFLVDNMCSRLCRWLRCLGIDAEFVGAETLRREVALLASTRCGHGSGCMFVTRDHRLAARARGAAVVLLGSDSAEEQLRELVGRFGIQFQQEAIMSRCSKCNAAAFELITPREGAQALVPAHIYDVASAGGGSGTSSGREGVAEVLLVEQRQQLGSMSAVVAAGQEPPVVVTGDKKQP